MPLIAASFLPMKASSASPVRRTLLGGHFAPSSEMRRTLSRRPRHSNVGCCAIMCCLIFGCTTFHQKARSIKMAIGSCNVQGRCTSIFAASLTAQFPPESAQCQDGRLQLPFTRVSRPCSLLDLLLLQPPPKSALCRDGHW